MPRLIVYGRSTPCPDMLRWERWVRQHPLAYVELDIDADADARAFVVRWTGHESVPTLVIAPDDGHEPMDEPAPLAGRRARGADRGSMLTEPSDGQVEAFLTRAGIPFGGPGGSDPSIVESTVTRSGRQRGSIGDTFRRLLGGAP